MLLRFLARDGDVAELPHHRFRWRGDGVSRIEGLSDAVFGFAITLLVVSLEVPKNTHDLLALGRGFIPFVASFFVLFNIWRLQFAFFRRYGLEDKRTELLTGALLVMVLFFVYPLKFLFTVLGNAVMTRDFETLKASMRIDDIPDVLGLYALGMLGLFTVFILLYRHAYNKRDQLQLNELETFDTMAMIRKTQRGALIPVMILVWSGAQMIISDHMKARDNVWETVYFAGCAAIIATAVSQRIFIRSLVRDRAAIAATVLDPETFDPDPQRPAPTLLDPGQ
ncbi:MAG: TMEM175 family protein [bacterium]